MKQLRYFFLHWGRLGLLGIGLPLAVWLFGLRRTVELWDNYSDLGQQLGQLQKDTFPERITNPLVPPDEISLSNGKILGQLSRVSAANRVKVVSFTPWLVQREKDHKIYAAEMVLSGRYIPLVKMMEQLALGQQNRKIVSAAFKLSRDPFRRSRDLQLTVWIQQLEN